MATAKKNIETKEIINTVTEETAPLKTTKTNNQKLIKTPEPSAPITTSKNTQITSRQIDKDEYVEVLNNTIGTLVYVNSKTNGEWNLEGYGTRDVMQVSDLVTMKSNQSKILTEGWIIIDDEDVVNYLRLGELYKTIIKPDNIDDFFKLSESKMKESISKQPKGIKLMLGQMAKKKIESGEFDSLTKQKILEDLLGISFSGQKFY